MSEMQLCLRQGQAKAPVEPSPDKPTEAGVAINNRSMVTQQTPDQIQSTATEKSSIPMSRNKPHLLDLPLKIRQQIYVTIASQIELHLCMFPHCVHNQVRPNIVGHPGDLARNCRGPRHSRSFVHVLGYTQTETGRRLLPKDWLVSPSLVCRQLHQEWSECLRKTSFKTISFDEQYSRYIRSRSSRWVRQQLHHCEHLKLICNENLLLPFFFEIVPQIPSGLPLGGLLADNLVFFASKTHRLREVTVIVHGYGSKYNHMMAEFRRSAKKVKDMPPLPYLDELRVIFR